MGIAIATYTLEATEIAITVQATGVAIIVVYTVGHTISNHSIRQRNCNPITGHGNCNCRIPCSHKELQSPYSVN